MDVAPSPPWRACPPRRASLASPKCPHSRFLTSDFRFPLAPALSTCDVSTFDSSTFLPSRSLSPLESISMRRAPKGKSSGPKLFAMSKCAARTQKNRPCKCLGMRALQSMRVSSPLESVFAKNLGGTPRLCQVVDILSGSPGPPRRFRELEPKSSEPRPSVGSPWGIFHKFYSFDAGVA